MKRILPPLMYFPVLLLLCHQLLFILLNFASLSMTSDSDINSAGVKFLLLLPIVVISGLWATYQLFQLREDRLEYKSAIIFTLSIHGGLGGMATTNILMRTLDFDFNNQMDWLTLIALAFITTTFFAAIGLRSIAKILIQRTSQVAHQSHEV